MENKTAGTDFILLGLTDRQELQTVILVLFCLIYIITVLGNLGITFLIIKSPKLHTPMYFFIMNLSFVELGYSTCIVPKMLASLSSRSQSISFIGCAAQFYLFASLVISELYILLIMSFDRYMAICYPLHYTRQMSPRFCVLLVAISHTYGFTDAMTQTVLTFRLPYCGSHEIQGFFCSDPSLLKVACGDLRVKQTLILMSAGFNLSITSLGITLSYTFIISAILRIRSAEARRKTFSTCSSHLVSVFIFYGSLCFMYLRPSSEQSMDQDKVVTVFYTVIIPMLNPMIYSLRTREVKEALKHTLKRTFTS
ncbi:olfactory receptor 5B21-like [Lissotriton helveticus]